MVTYESREFPKLLFGSQNRGILCVESQSLVFVCFSSV